MASQQLDLWPKAGSRMRSERKSLVCELGILKHLNSRIDSCSCGVVRHTHLLEYWFDQVSDNPSIFVSSESMWHSYFLEQRRVCFRFNATHKTNKNPTKSPNPDMSVTSFLPAAHVVEGQMVENLIFCYSAWSNKVFLSDREDPICHSSPMIWKSTLHSDKEGPGEPCLSLRTMTWAPTCLLQCLLVLTSLFLERLNLKIRVLISVSWKKCKIKSFMKIIQSEPPRLLCWWVFLC